MYATTNGMGGLWIYYGIIALMFLALYFFQIRPQNKREKELTKLRSNLKVGDEVMTIGGFYGTVVRIKDDRITIASGAEKTKLEVTRAAISTVLNRDVVAESKDETTEKSSPKSIKKLSKKETSEESEATENE